MLLEALVGDDASLWQAVQSFSNFDVDPTVVNKRKKIILVDDFLWNDADWELHVLVAIHGRV